MYNVQHLLNKRVFLYKLVRFYNIFESVLVAEVRFDSQNSDFSFLYCRINLPFVKAVITKKVGKLRTIKSLIKSIISYVKSLPKNFFFYNHQ